MGGGGGWGKNQKKFMQGKMPRKKIRAKKKVKKKKFMQKEGPILGFHMTAMLVSPNNEMAAMLVSRSNPPGIESYYYANVFFCFR